MNVLVQRIADGSFLAGDGTWERESGNGHRFQSSNHALRFCCEGHVFDVQVVLQFEDSRYNIYLPLKNTSSNGGRADAPTLPS
ncbi:MAG TPA: hypothetical protein VK846_10400 [Candidatus Limnocylindria bacterium]|nr:hypothetical protein [Candidatus Limnocylindria bacterium]